MPNVQDSINCWLPEGTGLREEIDAISTLYPGGFEGVRTTRTRRSILINDLEKRRRKLNSERTYSPPKRPDFRRSASHLTVAELRRQVKPSKASKILGVHD